MRFETCLTILPYDIVVDVVTAPTLTPLLGSGSDIQGNDVVEVPKRQFVGFKAAGFADCGEYARLESCKLSRDGPAARNLRITALIAKPSCQFRD